MRHDSITAKRSPVWPNSSRCTWRPAGLPSAACLGDASHAPVSPVHGTPPHQKALRSRWWWPWQEGCRGPLQGSRARRHARGRPRQRARGACAMRVSSCFDGPHALLPKVLPRSACREGGVLPRPCGTLARWTRAPPGDRLSPQTCCSGVDLAPPRGSTAGHREQRRRQPGRWAGREGGLRSAGAGRWSGLRCRCRR